MIQAYYCVIQAYYCVIQAYYCVIQAYYCVIQPYIHTFFAKALVGDVLLTSNSNEHFPAKSTTGSYWIRTITWQTRKDTLHKRIFLCTFIWTEPLSSRTRLFTIYAVFRHNQTNFPYTFSLYSNAQSEEKQRGVWYLSQLQTISSSGTTYCIKEHVQLSIWLKSQKSVFHLLRQCLCGTSSFCWRFSLTALMCREFHQLAEIYVVLFQLILHILQCLFVRMCDSEQYTNICCKQIMCG